MFKLVQPQESVFTDQNGKEHTYIISKFDAWNGREILCQFPLTSLPKVGDYTANAEVARKIMTCVGVRQPGKSDEESLRLTTVELINNHVPDAVIQLSIEREMFKYNFGFFLEEKALTFFEMLMQKVDSKISSMLTDSLVRSSQTEKPPSAS